MNMVKYLRPRDKYQVLIVLVSTLLLLGCSQTVAPPQPTITPTIENEQGVFIRDPDVPDLPFEDNPDPAACGIPVNWGDDAPAWLTGHYQGKLIQPTVFLYDSHLRLSIKGQAPSGSRVRVILFQENPVLDYFLVETIDHQPKQQGWVPAPFLSFEPVE